MPRTDYPAPPLDTFRAILDLRNSGVEIRDVGEKVFTVTHPRLDPGKWAADFLFNGSWLHSGLRNRGTDPMRAEGFDFSDPQQLAENVILDHDYPDPDRLGEMPTEN